MNIASRSQIETIFIATAVAAATAARPPVRCNAGGMVHARRKGGPGGRLAIPTAPRPANVAQPDPAAKNH